MMSHSPSRSWSFTRPHPEFALVVTLIAALASPGRAGAQAPTVTPGPFQATSDSLKAYAYPDWFRDAKLGIWAHWGPQSVPMFGDWYARQLYQQGHPQYKDHLEHFGHPSKTGYKDLIPLWKAEKWDPDRLMDLYKKAGARYFVSMGVHHDNFDLWNSTHHAWNAVKMGPHRDVVGDWQKAARKRGLKFGVSEHLGASFTWFQDSHRSDKTGPLAGVPYDGADPKYQDLYHPPAAADDTGWYSKDPRWQGEWFARIRDLVDQYQPDLLYTDGAHPFQNEVGLSLIAHLYNASAARHGGTPDVVYTCKEKSDGRWVEDLERGVMPGIRPHPWQTDTSIGDWFYNRTWKYRDAGWVITMLVDIVSKNGNLLINVVQRPDGSLDPQAEETLAEMASWIAINGEGIYGTRPWLIHGEGPIRARGGHFREDFAYSARDIRFTAKGDVLYAFAMGWPADGKLLIRSLGRYPGVTGRIDEVTLLGHGGPLRFNHDEAGLAVDLPATAPCRYAVALKIRGADLRGFKPELAPSQSIVIAPDAAGKIALDADRAELHGDQIKVEEKMGKANIGFWDRPEDHASWKVKFPAAGKYRVAVTAATIAPDARVLLDVAGSTLSIAPENTGGWDVFHDSSAGTIDVPRAGELEVALRPAGRTNWRPINVRAVTLTPEGR
ncbi:alpha-L-fucosidase [Aquisphaera insulae]|uniref:alpha-L-fucosidase n=1 Tax=Aquisphaera insulae TaxID=2712864 RepID=UPI0013E9E53A|nr:alpha-L-fucosidase [Aquisphaera insulae]